MSRYSLFPIAANGTRVVASAGINTDVHGFLCTTAGSVRIGLGADGSGADIIPATAVTAGQYLRIPASFSMSCAIVLSGGAVGVLFANYA